MKLAVVGAKGRMGQAILRLAEGEVVRTIDKGDAMDFSGADAVIDFSHPEIVPGVAEAAAKSKVALVSGTTGLDAKANAALDAASKSIPLLWEPNMSVGVLVLGRLVKQALEMLPDFDVEIVESHHKLKVDAPSGTALRLLEIAKTAREGAQVVTGREGKPGARKNEIGVMALRGGDVIGDHTVHLFGLGERIELTHRATNRDLFARGAIAAARALAGKPAGRYRLADLF